MPETLKKHEVQAGETFSSVLRKYYGGYSKELKEKVLAAHNISHIDQIPEGLTLNLPGQWSFPKPETKEYEQPEKVVSILVNKSAVSETPAAEPKKLEKNLPEGDYWQAVHEKNCIVLHFTAGYTWESAYNTFLKPGRVATPYVIDTDGPLFVVELFDPKYWSYHLGVKGSNSMNNAHDKRSIGIEIVNIGPVWKKGDGFKDYVGKKYTEDRVVVGKNRDADGGVKFPAHQVDAVCDLVNWLCQEFDIPRTVPKDKTSFQLPALAGFTGIMTHQHFRHDKYDMGTAWPWEVMIDRCGLTEI